MIEAVAYAAPYVLFGWMFMSSLWAFVRMMELRHEQDKLNYAKEQYQAHMEAQKQALDQRADLVVARPSGGRH